MKTGNKTLKQIYDRSCTRASEKPKTKSSPSIKPSMLGSPCLRKNFYSFNRVEEDYPFPLANSRIANLGTAIGKMLHDAFDAEGVVIKWVKPDGTYEIDRNTGEPDPEFRLTSPELGVKLGKIDAIVELDDGLWVTEIKSIKWEQYQNLKAPKPDHMIQAVLYLYLFNKDLAEGKFAHIERLAKHTKAKGVRFIYYGKDKSELKEFVVENTDDTFRQIVYKIQTIIDFSQRDELPPKTPDYCASCSYRDKCAANKKN